MEERWDICDEHGRPTGRTCRKGEPLPPGCYHRIVHVWMQNRRGEFFITQRAPEKEQFPLLWESTGGSALAGEESLAAALREAREETGLALNPEAGVLFRGFAQPANPGPGKFIDVWLFRKNVAAEDFVPRAGETVAAKCALPEEILAMWRAGAFFQDDYAEDLFDAARITTAALAENDPRRAQIAAEVLRDLPGWFGIPQATAEYIAGAARLPMWAAFYAGRAVGFLTLRRHFAQTCEIDCMGVLRAFHGQGAGRALLAAAQAFCRAQGCCFLTVKTLGPSRPDAGYAATRRFYQGAGFVPLEENTLWGEDCPCLILAKSL